MDVYGTVADLFWDIINSVEMMMMMVIHYECHMNMDINSFA